MPKSANRKPGRPKTDNVLVRMTMPRATYERFERFATALGWADAKVAIFNCATLQLAQFEVTTTKANLAETEHERTARATRVAAELNPALAGEVTIAPSFPEKPEPEPEPRRDFGLRPRGEIDELGSYALLEALVAGR